MTRLAGVMCMIVLAGCVAPQSAPVAGVDPAMDAFVQRHVAQGRRAEATGDLAAALYEWRVVAVADSAHPEAPARIRALRRRIDKRVDEAVSAAQDAEDPRSARKAWLRVLALEGNNKQAREALREDARVRRCIDLFHGRAPRHVRLTRAQPDVSEQDVLEADLVLTAFNSQDVRPARRE